MKQVTLLIDRSKRCISGQRSTLDEIFEPIDFSIVKWCTGNNNIGHYDVLTPQYARQVAAGFDQFLETR